MPAVYTQSLNQVSLKSSNGLWANYCSFVFGFTRILIRDACGWSPEAWTKPGLVRCH